MVGLDAALQLRGKCPQTATHVVKGSFQRLADFVSKLNRNTIEGSSLRPLSASERTSRRSLVRDTARQSSRLARSCRMPLLAAFPLFDILLLLAMLHVPPSENLRVPQSLAPALLTLAGLQSWLLRALRHQRTVDHVSSPLPLGTKTSSNLLISQAFCGITWYAYRMGTETPFNSFNAR